MTIAHGELPAESTAPPVPTVAAPESAVRLIVVAFGWFLLATIPSVLVGIAKGFASGFIRGLTKGASELQIPPTWSQLLTMLGTLGFCFLRNFIRQLSQRPYRRRRRCPHWFGTHTNCQASSRYHSLCGARGIRRLNRTFGLCLSSRSVCPIFRHQSMANRLWQPSGNRLCAGGRRTVFPRVAVDGTK